MVLRGTLELGKGGAALGGQAALELPPVGREGFAGDQLIFIEFLDDAAEIAGIKSKLEPDLLGGEITAMGEFVHHPRLAQRERGLEQVLVEHLELARIKAVEG